MKIQKRLIKNRNFDCLLGQEARIRGEEALAWQQHQWPKVSHLKAYLDDCFKTEEDAKAKAAGVMVASQVVGILGKS